MRQAYQYPRWFWLGLAAFVVVLALWLVPGPAVPHRGMLGKRGSVQRACMPEGTVTVAGELWRARSLGDVDLRPGEVVVVRDVEGLCLLVERPGADAA